MIMETKVLTELEQAQAARNKTSLRRAVNMMCRDCIYDPTPGNGSCLAQTDACTCRRCPLWNFRPRRKSSVEGQETPITASVLTCEVPNPQRRCPATAVTR